MFWLELLKLNNLGKTAFPFLFELKEDSRLKVFSLGKDRYHSSCIHA